MLLSEDVRDFAKWGDRQIKILNQYLWAIKTYAEFTSNHAMDMTANALIGARYAAQMKLQEFRGVLPEHAQKLASMGIKSPLHMLEAGRTEKDREQLAAASGVPIEKIEELVKLSDLSRIPGVKTIRARLYHDAGFDTLEKLAACDPEDFRARLAEFTEETGFEGGLPLPKEAASTVATARHLLESTES